MIAPTAPIIRNEEAPHGGDYAQGFPGVRTCMPGNGNQAQEAYTPKGTRKAPGGVSPGLEERLTE